MNMLCFCHQKKNSTSFVFKKMNEWVFGPLETECYINESIIRVAPWAAIKTYLIILHPGGSSHEGLALSPG